MPPSKAATSPSRGQVISTCQTVASHRGDFVMAHNIIAEDINEEPQSKNLKMKKKIVSIVQFGPMN
jgi:hypothetical protein